LQQQRLRAEGKCPTCWKVLPEDLLVCLPCKEKKNEYNRRVKGYKPWVPGKPGRPPRQVVEKTAQYLSVIEQRMRHVDWSLSNKQIERSGLTTETTARKYRKIYAPETIPKRASRVAIAESKCPSRGARGKRKDTDGSGRSAKV
jgi:hypothetical protein